MRGFSGISGGRCLAVTALLLCCMTAGYAAEKNNASQQKQSVRRGSLIGDIKPVSSDLDIDVESKYKRDIKKRYAQQDLKMAEAVKIVESGKFSEGVKKAEAIRDELKFESEYVKSAVVKARLAEAESLVARLRYLWGKSKLREADDAFGERRLPDAIALAAEAALISSALTKEADDMRKRCFDMQKMTNFQNATALSIANPNLANQRKEVKNLLAEARVLFENKRYVQAMNKIEQVYLRDPFNLDAVSLAGKIYRVYFTEGYYRHRADFELVAAYANWQWAEPVFEAPVKQERTRTEIKDVSMQDTYNKLNRIIFPRFEFDRADVGAVIKFLRTRNREFDPEKEGVDIQDASNQEDIEKLGKVTLRLSDIPLGEVLRYISIMTGLKYRVEPDGIRIGTSLDTMYERTYEISNYVNTMVFSSSSAEGDGGQGGGSQGSSVFKKGDSADTKLEKDKSSDEELKLSEITEIKVTSEMFKKYLEKHGIKFGPGSSVAYLESSRELVVKNTLQNLNAISSLIREQNAIEAPLVMIEIKSIEISDTDMEELGFDWSLGENNLNKNMDNTGQLLSPGVKGWMFGSGSNTRISDKGERGSMMPIRTGLAGTESSTALINNLNIFPMLFGSHNPFGSDVPINISLTVNAISQNTRTELISAPKIIALSDYPAMAKLTKTYYFPSDWSDLEIETDTGDNNTTFTITRPNPEFDDEQELGIIFRVTPTVTEADTISLNLDMQVMGENGRDTYYFSLNGIVGDRVINETFSVWKPIITERSIKTIIDVYDGQTVVVAGSTDNRVSTRTDKIPFLGELPFIGRFFQSQAEQAERRNMLLFVTARLLGTDGSPVNAVKNVGVPDFNR